MDITLKNLRHDYIKLVATVASTGSHETVRGLATRELRDVTLRVPSCTRPMLPIGIGRSISQPWAAIDTLDMIAGTCHPKLYDAVAPGWRDVLINTTDAAVHYAAYGPRIKSQMPIIVSELSRPERAATRSAIVQIWRPEDLAWPADRPCTLTLQFLARDGRLHLTVQMRSNDVWRGVPYDVFAFTQLQQTVARVAKLEPGSYTHHATSFHIYDSDLPALDALHPTEDDVELPRGLMANGTWESVVKAAETLLDLKPVSLNRWYLQQIAKTGRRL